MKVRLQNAILFLFYIMPTDYEIALATFQNQATAFPNCNKSFRLHDITITYDGSTICSLDPVNMYNDIPSTYNNNFAQMYAYNSSGALILDAPKVTFTQGNLTTSNLNFALSFDANAGSIAAIANILLRVVSANNGIHSEKLLAYRSFVPINGLVPEPPPPACFTEGSLIATPEGYKPVEILKTGDTVFTADRRTVKVNVVQFTVRTTAETAPFLIPANTFSAGSPKRDLHLSPWHAFQVKKGFWLKPKLASILYENVVQYDLDKDVTYYHLECPNYFKDNLICNGSIVESFAGEQLNAMKGRVYTYNKQHKLLTRIAGIPHTNKIE